MRKFWLLLLALIFFAWPMNAMETCTIGTLDTCAGSSAQGTTAWVTDGEGPGDCIQGSGTYQHACMRARGTWVPVDVQQRVADLHFTAFDQAADDLRCAGNDAGVTARVCSNGSALAYFAPYTDSIYVTGGTCRLFTVTQAGAAQTVSLYPYFAHGVTGTQGSTSTLIDLETITEGQVVDLTFNELAAQPDGLLTLRASFSASGTGVFSAHCVVFYYE